EYSGTLFISGETRSTILTRLEHALSTFGHSPAPTPARIAAPYAAPSIVFTIASSASSTSARICRHNALFAPPPETLTCSIEPSPPLLKNTNMPLRQSAAPPTPERARAPLACQRVKPIHAPQASGSGYGVRSPLRYGRKTNPSLPEGTVSASSIRSSKLDAGATVS